MTNLGPRPGDSFAAESDSTTSGITSPARWTTTRSPTRTSFASIMSWLCRVARRTVTPRTTTGDRRATGVRMPVRPTKTTMSSTVVSARSGENLAATAQRGDREISPSSF